MRDKTDFKRSCHYSAAVVMAIFLVFSIAAVVGFSYLLKEDYLLSSKDDARELLYGTTGMIVNIFVVLATALTAPIIAQFFFVPIEQLCPILQSAWYIRLPWRSVFVCSAIGVRFILIFVFKHAEQL